MCELTHGVAGELHGHGMVCVNPPLLLSHGKNGHANTPKFYKFTISPVVLSRLPCVMYRTVSQASQCVGRTVDK
jgi:hypothetical protein